MFAVIMRIISGQPQPKYRQVPVMLFGSNKRPLLTNAFQLLPISDFLLQPFRKPKRVRTAFSPSQLLKLEHAFESNHYVVGAERKTLAQNLSLTETQVITTRIYANCKRSTYIQSSSTIQCTKSASLVHEWINYNTWGGEKEVVAARLSIFKRVNGEACGNWKKTNKFAFHAVANSFIRPIALLQVYVPVRLLLQRRRRPPTWLIWMHRKVIK